MTSLPSDARRGIGDGACCKSTTGKAKIAPLLRRCRCGIILAAVIMPAVAGCASVTNGANDRLVDGIATEAHRIDAIDRDPFFAEVLAAQRSLPREWFLPKRMRFAAYLQQPLLIGHDQTISDPLLVAVMTTAAHVRPGDRVLEIGTGSGYQAAVLSRLGAQVVTIEIVPELAKSAAATLRRHGLAHVEGHVGDGRLGWQARAPYDAIIVTAGATAVPSRLLDQLAVGGRLVMPVDDVAPDEQLLVYRREGAGFTICSLGPAVFVTLTGTNAPEAARPPETSRFCYGRATT